MPGGVVVYRADKGEEILYANKKLYEIYGCEDYDEFLLDKWNFSRHGS